MVDVEGDAEVERPPRAAAGGRHLEVMREHVAVSVEQVVLEGRLEGVRGAGGVQGAVHGLVRARRLDDDRRQGVRRRARCRHGNGLRLGNGLRRSAAG